MERVALAADGAVADVNVESAARQVGHVAPPPPPPLQPIAVSPPGSSAHSLTSESDNEDQAAGVLDAVAAGGLAAATDATTASLDTSEEVFSDSSSITRSAMEQAFMSMTGAEQSTVMAQSNVAKPP